MITAFVLLEPTLRLTAVMVAVWAQVCSGTDDLARGAAVTRFGGVRFPAGMAPPEDAS